MEKLVRDKIPELFNLKFKKLDSESILKSLLDKVVEESKELRAASEMQIIDEIADIIEVLDEYCRRKKISPRQVKIAKIRKFKERGGFRKGLAIEQL